MKNDGPRSNSSGSRLGARSTVRAISRIVWSGASTVASTVRSAGASVASSIVDRDNESGHDRVQFAAFDKLECEADIVRQVLLLGYKSGFQVWDVEEADNVHELVSRHDGPVSFLQMQQKPLPSKRLADKFADVRPLLIVAGDGNVSHGSDIHEWPESLPNGGNSNCHGAENGAFMPTVIQFYSLASHSYVHVLKFRTAVYSVRCSPRVVAILLETQIYCFDAATLEMGYTLLTHPIFPGYIGFGGIGYGPLAVGARWLAYTGVPVAVANAGRISPQCLIPTSSLSTSSNGSLVAYYAKESSKQLAAGMVNIGDMGYKKLSRYCSELLPERKNSLRAGSHSFKTNGTTNGHLLDAEDVGMVIIRDIVSKSVISQFRAHRSPVSALCFDPSGTLLVTASVNGHNINVFQITPSPVEGLSRFDVAGSYVHLYRLQRGLTNAVIQDISFSSDSQWVMISSSKGTSHLFALSPLGGAINPHNDASLTNEDNGLGPSVNPAAQWRHTRSGPLMSNQQTLCASGCPVTLSPVSRIKNGNNSWRGTVTGAAAAVTGRVNSLSGAIASVFHNCGPKSAFMDASPVRAKRNLLVFSPLGCVIQYVLHLSAGDYSRIDLSGPNTVSSEPDPDMDVRLFVEALQKWDVCQRRNRRDREDDFDIYESGDSSKVFPKGMKRGNSVFPTDDGTVRNVKPEEKNHLYISEVELQMHPPCIPLWAKPEIHFQAMIMCAKRTGNECDLGGEIEIERIPTHAVEARSKDLVPVFDFLQAPKFQQQRVSRVDGQQSGLLLLQKPAMTEDGRLSCQSSCNFLDGLSEDSTLMVTEIQNGIHVNGCGELPLSKDLIKGFVNNGGGPTRKTQPEFVNNGGSPKMEAQLKFVNSIENPKMEAYFVDNDNEVD